MSDEGLSALRVELEAIAPNDWPGVFRSVSARRRVAELLDVLDRPPASHSRLGWELRARLYESIGLEEAA